MDTATMQLESLEQRVKDEKKVIQEKKAKLYGGGAWDSVTHGINCVPKGHCKEGQCEKPIGYKEQFPLNANSVAKCEEAGSKTIVVHETVVEKAANQIVQPVGDDSIEKLTKALNRTIMDSVRKSKGDK